MAGPAAAERVLIVADADSGALQLLLARFGIVLALLEPDATIPGSYWGAPEAGVQGSTVYVRPDTPVHSLLHEASHIICMDEARRERLDTDAGGDDLEEAAVCYLQILLADELSGVGRERLLRDMDAWGYSFRFGSAGRWFREDAGDAAGWLAGHGLMDAAGRPVFRRR
jgi:hypothetical protein